jgi:glycosyltransferase involved in cell wall biosynthesis
VCGNGGLFPDPGDYRGTAKNLATMLSDEDTWGRLSEAAIDNAAKYHWDLCSKKLLKMFEVV